MAILRTVLVSVAGSSMLLVGIMESVLAEIARPGVARTQPSDIAVAGCVQSVAEADVDLEAGDADAGPHDHGWHASGPAPEVGLSTACAGFVDAPPEDVAVRRPCATAVIRGPPARG